MGAACCAASDIKAPRAHKSTGAPSDKISKLSSIVDSAGGFISTEQLQSLIDQDDLNKESKLCILDATMNPDGDPLKMHAESKIVGARYFDLSLCRDMKSPLPHMMPS